MRPDVARKLESPRRRVLALRAFAVATLIATCAGAAVLSSSATIVAAPTAAPQRAEPGAPAIAERLDGGYELLTLPPAPHVAPRTRAPAGVGVPREIRVAVALLNLDDAPVKPFARALSPTRCSGRRSRSRASTTSSPSDSPG